VLRAYGREGGVDRTNELSPVFYDYFMFVYLSVSQSVSRAGVITMVHYQQSCQRVICL
jgi:hypothetical protein